MEAVYQRDVYQGDGESDTFWAILWLSRMIIEDGFQWSSFQEMHSRCLRDANIIPEKSKSIHMEA